MIYDLRKRPDSYIHDDSPNTNYSNQMTRWKLEPCVNGSNFQFTKYRYKNPNVRVRS